MGFRVIVSVDVDVDVDVDGEEGTRLRSEARSRRVLEVGGERVGWDRGIGSAFGVGGCAAARRCLRFDILSRTWWKLGW